MHWNRFCGRSWRVVWVVGVFLLLTLTKGGHVPVASVGTADSGDTWRRVADMPTPRRGLAAAAVDGKIYVIGGINTDENEVAVVEMYNPATDTWAPRAAMSTKRSTPSAVEVNGKIYVIGGHDSTKSVATIEKYDPATDMWTARAAMSTARIFLDAVVVGGKIYAIGGRDENWNIFSTVEEYDPATDTWQTRAPMPTGRSHIGAAVVNEKIYVFGGFDGTNYISTVEEYDPAMDTWRSRPAMPITWGGMVAVELNGKIYAVGGRQSRYGAPVAIVKEYDPATNTWTPRAPMSTARTNLAAAVVGKKIYAFGGNLDGTSSGTDKAIALVEECTPPVREQGKWLEGWEYRKSHMIQSSPTGLVTNYPIRLTVHYGSEVDSGADVYLNGQCRADFGDLRFTQSDGQTELDYWVEEKVERDYADFWVEVASIPASPSTTTIYVYYGNSGATTTSNGAATFQFFEPFTNFDSSKWSISSNYNLGLQYYGYTIEDGALVMYIGTRGKNKLMNGGYSFSSQETFPVVDSALVMRTKAQKVNEGDKKEHYNIGIGFNDSSVQRVWGRGAQNEHKYSGEFSIGKIWSFGTWDGSLTAYETRELRITSSQVKLYHNGEYQYTEPDPVSGSGKLLIWFWIGDGNSLDAWGELYVDWIFLRNYIDPEPSHGSWGSEETSGSPTVMVVSPNGGEYWQGTQPITWEATDPQDDPLTYTVYYSPNGGATWTQLEAGLMEPSYAWDTTTVVDGVNYLIKVEASDGVHTGADVSDALFEIANAPPAPINTAPTVQVIRPNGGERVRGTYELRWEATDPDGDVLTFTISYSPNGGQTWTQIASGVTGTSYQWDISGVQVGANYLIKVEASDGALTTDDRSDAPFTIEREPETETEGVFIPSFGILEGLSALLVLLGLGWRKKRPERCEDG